MYDGVPADSTSAYLMRAIDELLWGENDWPPFTIIGRIV